MCLKYLRVCDCCKIWPWDCSGDIRKNIEACSIHILSQFSLPKYNCIHFTSLTYTCHWHEHSIASFRPAVQLLRLHCLIATACIMTQIALPRCYRMTHYLATQMCFPVYKTSFQRRRALSLFSCIFRLNTSCASQSPPLECYWSPIELSLWKTSLANSSC